MRKSFNDYQVEDNVVWLSLTRGKSTCIDLKNLGSVSHYRWYARKCDKEFYAATMLWDGDRSSVLYLHKLLLPASLVDHRDRDTLNNLEDNLRTASPAESVQNRRKHSNNLSGFKGVVERGGKFTAKIQVAQKAQWLGTFDTAPQAAVAYDIAAKKFFGEYAALNFPSI